MRSNLLLGNNRRAFPKNLNDTGLAADLPRPGRHHVVSKDSPPPIPAVSGRPRQPAGRHT